MVDEVPCILGGIICRGEHGFGGPCLYDRSFARQRLCSWKPDCTCVKSSCCSSHTSAISPPPRTPSCDLEVEFDLGAGALLIACFSVRLGPHAFGGCTCKRLRVAGLRLGCRRGSKVQNFGLQIASGRLHRARSLQVAGTSFRAAGRGEQPRSRRT